MLELIALGQYFAARAVTFAVMSLVGPSIAAAFALVLTLGVSNPPDLFGFIGWVGLAWFVWFLILGLSALASHSDANRKVKDQLNQGIYGKDFRRN